MSYALLALQADCRQEHRMSSMDIALAQARLAADRGEVPVGAVLLDNAGNILAQDGNRTEELHDASAHAEMLVLRAAANLRASPRLPDCELVVTLEPCPMCAAAISAFRIKRVTFGAYDPKGGGIEHGPRLYEGPGSHFRPDVIGGVRERDSATLLKTFFAGLRTPNRLATSGDGGSGE
jgi:tRNA(Arg) A34 adenosine deaminase TadA